MELSRYSQYKPRVSSHEFHEAYIPLQEKLKRKPLARLESKQILAIIAGPCYYVVLCNLHVLGGCSSGMNMST